MAKFLDDRPRNSLSDMLNSFPPPAIGTPTREGQPPSRWPSPFVNSNLNLAQSVNNDRKPNNRKRRCCGLPIWAFVLILIILFLLIAAAVVIPIVLIVLPKQNQAISTTTDPLANCTNSNPCSNGGFSIVSSGSCRCICTNGFTGSGCTNPQVSGSECVTQDFGQFKQATLGADIPRLFTGASNFSIILNTTAILADFSASQLLCSDENNLVSFFKAPQRRSVPHPVEVYVAPIPLMTLAPRLAVPEPDAEAQNAVTSNGIVFEGPTTTAPNLATTGTATSSLPASTSLATPSTQQVDFSKVAVLYILQQLSLPAAANTRSKLDQAFGNGIFNGPIVIDPNITVDLNLLKVTVNNSTTGSS
jgi:hypothetical protein